ncbi:MAG: DNA-directed RNA polymerase subunit omega [Clostridia bacterium]|nr:DNA-directed RNA polymerase subunit omega [Clostridia bacterium]
MLVKPKTEDLLKKVDNRYELVIAISRRGRQIITGSSPMVDSGEDEKSELTVAALELEKGKFDVEDEEVNNSNE